MKISIPLSQPMGWYDFDRAYISKPEDERGMYLYIEEVPRKTLNGCIKYLKKNHKKCIAHEYQHFLKNKHKNNLTSI